MLINLERVGGLGTRPDDVLLLGECDIGVKRLVEALGWTDELESLWQEVTPSSAVASSAVAEDHSETAAADLEQEIAKITGEVDQTLKISQSHTSALRREMAQKHELQEGLWLPKK